MTHPRRRAGWRTARLAPVPVGVPLGVPVGVPIGVPVAVLVAFLVAVPVAVPVAFLGSLSVAQAAKLKVPRFVSLRFDKVNLRAGPGTEFPVNWVYKRRGLPVEVIRDLDNWRQVRDRWGTVGWIHVSNLSGKRTILVDGGIRTLRDAPDAKAKAIARAEPGVVAALEKCRKSWCRISTPSRTGWIRRSAIWGVYDKETID